MKEKCKRTMANYFGLTVQVIVQMGACSLIQFKGRQFIVDTADLTFELGLKCAA